jgi:L-ascorbate metabolism protein UlaG (beta-lactamase superfamily)
MVVFLIIVLALVTTVWIFMSLPQFGRLASGERLARMKRSPNYKNGTFHNIHLTPNFSEDANMWKVMRMFFFEKRVNSKPPDVLPSARTDLLNLDPHKNVLVWFGHSSYFMQVDGKRILVDPVFSGAASPISVTTRAFKGSDIYTVDDFPPIDYLFISHDHWDHLDYDTVVKLKPKVKKVITGLGTAAHLERWGYDAKIIIEKDWNEEAILDPGFIVHTTSARHFSGRGFKRNASLWMAFVLVTPTMKLYLGGDSGYDTHFKEIGDKFGPFDLAILECGQYSPYWKYIHMMPEETVQAGIDLNAKCVFPVHWAKFSLSLSEWDDSIKRVTAEAAKRNMPLIHPIVGEAVDLRHPVSSVHWWERPFVTKQSH